MHNKTACHRVIYHQHTKHTTHTHTQTFRRKRCWLWLSSTRSCIDRVGNIFDVLLGGAAVRRQVVVVVVVVVVSIFTASDAKRADVSCWRQRRGRHEMWTWQRAAAAVRCRWEHGSAQNRHMRVRQTVKTKVYIERRYEDSHSHSHSHRHTDHTRTTQREKKKAASSGCAVLTHNSVPVPALFEVMVRKHMYMHHFPACTYLFQREYRSLWCIIYTRSKSRCVHESASCSSSSSTVDWVLRTWRI